MNDTKRIVEVQVRAPAAEIWNALTDPAFTRRYYYGSTFEGRLEPGANYLYRLPDGTEGVKGQLLEVEPPVKLVMTFEMAFHPEARRDPPSRLSWQIDDLGEHCTLRLVHDGMVEKSATFRATRNWKPVLAGLKTLLERARPAGVRR